ATAGGAATETAEVDAEASETTADGDGGDEASKSKSKSESGSGSSTGGKSETKRDDIASVRVDVDRLDELYGLVEQLVTSRIKLRREMDDSGIEKSENLDELDKISSNLQNTVMDMRLIPLKKVVNTFPRLVRDVARDQEKQVDFDIEGEDIELDRTILTEIRDPLMHILRNAVDHGIESPEEREAAGKSPEGHIELTATRERDHVTIRVSDDGAGLDVERLREKAVEKGVRTEAELAEMSDSDVYDLVFHPGFSTSEEVTDISGRGVGMDVVHSTVKQLDGTVSVDSEEGQGTIVSLRLPVTVAIVKVMFVEVGGTEYGIPVKNIEEIARARDVRTVNGREVIEHDDEIFPVVRLGEVLGEMPDGGNVGATAATD
ncbi:ATP-binding protein, partial [Halobium palmae]